MTYETFEIIIAKLQQTLKSSHECYKLGIDLIDYQEPYQYVIDLLLKETFTPEGHDWISWFLYEREGFSGTTGKAWDKDNNEICYDIPSLWRELESISSLNK